MHAGERSTSAEKLPIKFYTTADGLAHNEVTRIVRDSRGFLWFCTFEGLSRFDGYSFTTYGPQQGLPSQVINDLLETREGQYWVATSAGLCLFNPKGLAQRSVVMTQDAVASTPMFSVCFPGDDPGSREVTSLLQDHAGVIWCGTARGLYRMEQEGPIVTFRFIELGMPAAYGEARNVNAIVQDQRGALWVGSPTNGIYRLLPDGAVEHYDGRNGLPHNDVQSLMVDREGRIWAGTRLAGLCLLVSNPDTKRQVVARVYSLRDGLPSMWINQVFQGSAGTLWAASPGGLVRFIPTSGGRDFRFHSYARPHGLSSPNVQTLSEDRNGNLWLGTNGGAAKLARSGITTFTESDGFKIASAIFRDRAGALYVIAGPDDVRRQYVINRFDGERFVPIQLKLPSKVFYGWGWNQLVVKDSADEWWVATGSGVYRYPKVSSLDQLARASPKAVYTERDGLSSDEILRLFEDSRGHIWVGTSNPGGLSQWDRDSNALSRFAEQDGLPSLTSYYPISFAEDRAGAVWIGFNVGGGLVRYRDGRFTRFTSEDGLAEGGIFNLFVDSSGRLWVPTTRGGVCRIDDPEAEHPTIVTYTTNEGLSSNDVKAVTEDRWGRVYLGTGRGIDRLDTATGHLRHYTTNEGALAGEVHAALQDRDGALWFSYLTGVVRLAPEPDFPPLPPPVLITGLRIAGEAQPLSALGETDLAPIELSANRNDLQIDFVAPGFSPGDGLRYQYLVEGAGSDWSPLSDQHTVNFANLAPGRYRFRVRSVNSDGVLSETPANFSFRVMTPLWQRWWFISLTGVIALVIAYALYRYRVRRLVEIERIRTRIAADLHDDIGSSLSQIAVLSEVLRKQLGAQETRISNNISLIGSVSQEALDSMSDIVWAINPQNDHLNDLVRRMRRVASEMLPAKDIEFQFSVPTEGLDLRLGADIRRELFLMFKEALNNLVRHSTCKRADIELRIDRARLVLKVVDDGKGFDAGSISEGNGLTSLRRRAHSLGGETTISSVQESGTAIEVAVPYGRHTREHAENFPTNGSSGEQTTQADREG